MPVDLAVVRLDPSPTPNRGLKQLHTMGAEPKAISGINTLVQVVTLLLFQRPGSDVLRPELGVDLPGLLSKPLGSSQEHKADATILYSLLQDQIVAMQRGEEMEDDERLASLRLEQISIDGDKFVHRVRIVSAAGSSAVLNTKDLFI